MIIDYAFVFIHNVLIGYKKFSTSGEYLYSSSLAVLILYSFK